MLPDIATTAAERTAEARALIARAAGPGFVELVTLSALELCTLGGPAFALFEEDVARAWGSLGEKRWPKIMKQVTDGLAERHLLAPNPPGPDGVTWSLSPALGLALAAMCRPTFIVVTETARPGLRTPRFFALGDEAEPVRAVVVEEPVALPPGAERDFPNLRKLGPLGRFYQYTAVSLEHSARLLAEWAIVPPPAPPESTQPPQRGVALYHPGPGQETVGTRLGIRGDGATAHLAAPEDERPSFDQAGLAAVMLDLMTRTPR